MQHDAHREEQSTVEEPISLGDEGILPIHDRVEADMPVSGPEDQRCGHGQQERSPRGGQHLTEPVGKTGQTLPSPSEHPAQPQQDPERREQHRQVFQRPQMRRPEKVALQPRGVELHPEEFSRGALPRDQPASNPDKKRRRQDREAGGQERADDSLEAVPQEDSRAPRPIELHREESAHEEER